MKKDVFYTAVGDLDKKAIERFERIEGQIVNHKKNWIALVACCALVFGSLLGFKQLNSYQIVNLLPEATEITLSNLAEYQSVEVVQPTESEILSFNHRDGVVNGILVDDENLYDLGSFPMYTLSPEVLDTYHLIDFPSSEKYQSLQDTVLFTQLVTIDVANAEFYRIYIPPQSTVRFAHDTCKDYILMFEEYVSDDLTKITPLMYGIATYTSSGNCPALGYKTWKNSHIQSDNVNFNIDGKEYRAENQEYRGKEEIPTELYYLLHNPSDYAVWQTVMIASSVAP